MFIMLTVSFTIHFSMSVTVSISFSTVHLVQRCDPVQYWPLQTEDELELVNEVNFLHLFFISFFMSSSSA